jgi:hypothetical protein
VSALACQGKKREKMGEMKKREKREIEKNKKERETKKKRVRVSQHDPHGLKAAL